MSTKNRTIIVSIGLVLIVLLYFSTQNIMSNSIISDDGFSQFSTTQTGSSTTQLSTEWAKTGTYSMKLSFVGFDADSYISTSLGAEQDTVTTEAAFYVTSFTGYNSYRALGLIEYYIEGLLHSASVFVNGDGNICLYYRDVLQTLLTRTSTTAIPINIQFTLKLVWDAPNNQIKVYLNDAVINELTVVDLIQTQYFPNAVLIGNGYAGFGDSSVTNAVYYIDDVWIDTSKITLSTPTPIPISQPSPTIINTNPTPIPSATMQTEPTPVPTTQTAENDEISPFERYKPIIMVSIIGLFIIILFVGKKKMAV